MRSPTIRDVAKRAGVGVGTVSRVLNGSAHVRDETRQRVLQAIDDLEFRPNAAARQLSGGKTFSIGVVTPFFTRPSFVERLAGIQKVLADSPYDTVLYSARSPQRLAAQLLDLLTQNRVDGLVILSLPISEETVYELNPTLPIVVVDNAQVTRFPSVNVDYVHAGALAGEYLIQRGHTAIGFVGDRIESGFEFVSSQQCFGGLQTTLTAHGIPAHPAWYGFGPHGQDVARELALGILTQRPRPSAIFASSDVQAFGVLAAAQEMGLRVPDDLAVIGFDDIEAARYMNLTTIRQHLFESGRAGADRLLEWLQTGQLDDDEWQIMLPLEVVERATV